MESQISDLESQILLRVRTLLLTTFHLLLSRRPVRRSLGEAGSRPPTWDALAAAAGRLYLSKLDGSIVCLQADGP